MAGVWEELDDLPVAGVGGLGAEPTGDPGLGMRSVQDQTGRVSVLLEAGTVTAVRVARTLPADELEHCLLDVVTRLQRELAAEALGGAIGAGRDEVRRGQEQLAQLESTHRASMARAWELLDERRSAALRAEREATPWP